MTTIKIPELSLLVLVGTSGSGKSTFAARHFKPTEVLSSDFCRALAGDDENDQSLTEAAFQLLHFIAAKRLELGRLTVVDATNVQPDARKPLVQLAREHHVLPVAIVLDVPEKVSLERNRSRPERDFGSHVVRRQASILKRSLGRLEREGFRRVFVLRGEEQIASAEILRERAWTDRSDEHGPFDIVGDVHGCHDELMELLGELGYIAEGEDVLRHPEGRKAVFLGDLVDRGPATPAVLRTVMSMVEADAAICVPGNHENKLVRALKGRDVQIAHGLGESLAQLEQEPEEFRTKVRDFLDGLVSHFVLDDRKLVVAHAGMREEMQGRASAAVRAFALYGETTGEIDEFGLPVRYPWAEDYRGGALVVYGHTPVPEATWVNGTMDIDTGCVYGGKLTALRYPEKELVSVPAKRVYYEPGKPLQDDSAAPGADAPPPSGEVLDISDVMEKRGVETRLRGRLSIPEQNAAAALEVMSRFAIDPRWLIYLPPTMAPTATSDRPDLLEHPAEAFAAYRREGVSTVICEEKHMGSRAVAVVCRDEEVAARRFHVAGAAGAVYTRTGRRFFGDRAIETAVLAGARGAIESAGLWQEFDTDWLALDCEVLPWSLKAEELLRTQYAAVGAAAIGGLSSAVAELETAQARGVAGVGDVLGRQRDRLAMARALPDAYRPYCWSVSSAAEVRVAPFQLLAGERAAYFDPPHAWHMEIAERLASGAPDLMVPTRNLAVDVTDPSAESRACEWWEELTASGGEGMVVKPPDPIARGRKGIAQPGVKVRGREYLRIIYGPEYTAPTNMARLRQRGLGRKRSLAIREFALGIEALERFVRGEPLHRVHECVFGVLALESEPMDPRL
ncbi:MAG: polynucleotide kinase-phosphatase [Actinomycetota bacterium]|nr:polynucleotide kinase-phosphatase [Actinomycetota bacterium]